jgi:hypothetical protein
MPQPIVYPRCHKIYLGPRAAHLRPHHGASPRQAPRDLRGRRQRRLEHARRGHVTRPTSPDWPRSRRRSPSTCQDTSLSTHVVLAEHDAEGLGAKPEGELARRLQRDFGGFDSFKKQMSQVPRPSWDRARRRWCGCRSARLLTTQIYDHQSNPEPGRHSSLRDRLPGSTRTTCSTRTGRRSSSRRVWKGVELEGRRSALCATPGRSTWTSATPPTI